jgi:hypothetical protein
MSQIENVAAASGARFAGCQTLYGFFWQAWVGRLRLHAFLKPDPAPGLHDHAWPFVSLPLHSYVEDVLDHRDGAVRPNIVLAWRFNRRPATHTHRILGKWAGKGFETVPGTVLTLCWTGRAGRSWHYWRTDGGKVRAFPWRGYLRRIEGRPSL